MGDNCLGDNILLDGDPGLLEKQESAFISSGSNGLFGNVTLLDESPVLLGSSLWLEGELGLLAGDPVLLAGERAFPPGETLLPTGDKDLVLVGEGTLREGETALVLGDTGLLGGERVVAAGEAALFGVCAGGVRLWGEPGVPAGSSSSSKGETSTSSSRLGEIATST